jgi:hypothetical protein
VQSSASFNNLAVKNCFCCQHTHTHTHTNTHTPKPPPLSQNDVFPSLFFPHFTTAASAAAADASAKILKGAGREDGIGPVPRDAARGATSAQSAGAGATAEGGHMMMLLLLMMMVEVMLMLMLMAELWGQCVGGESGR